MFLHSIRPWFGVNSSSDHILVQSPELPSMPEGPDDEGSEYGFGWRNGLVTAYHRKIAYVFLQLYHSMLPHVGSYLSRLFACKMTGIGDIKADEIIKEGYIDHASHWDLPFSPVDGVIDPLLAEKLVNLMLREDIGIFCASDNEDRNVPSGLIRRLTVPFSKDQGDEAYYGVASRYRRPCWVSRYDEQSDTFTVFDTQTGTRTRFRISDNGFDSVDNIKPATPEFVDIKITDYCTNNCQYCYQDSGKDGRHASHDLVYSAALLLKDLHVLEVSLGGGEPTKHPNFTSILSNFREMGIVPNFTTRNMEWMRNSRVKDEVLANCGGLAFTVDRWYQLNSLLACVDENNVPRHKLTVQHVAIDPFYAKEVHEKAVEEGLKLSLVGFKRVGRGKSAPLDVCKFDYDDMSLFLKKGAMFGVDALMALEYSKQLERDGVPIELLRGSKEGQWSCYIDLTAKGGPVVAPSSYSPETQQLPCVNEHGTLDKDLFLKAFASF